MCLRASQTSVIREIQRSLASKEKTAVDVVASYIAQLKAAESHVDSFITISEEQALAHVGPGGCGPSSGACSCMGMPP